MENTVMSAETAVALNPAQSYALMRIVTGFLFLWHGTQKLLSVPMPPPRPVPDFVIAIAGPIELIGGTLVMIGLFAGSAAFLCSGLMAFAYWMVHSTQGLLPIQNMGELAALYCFVFLYIWTKGSGIWSVDAARGKVS
jgi:putative oxidoreductase